MMETKEFINVAVNNEFQDLYTRNIVKCYLYKHLLLNPYTKRQYSNYQIGLLVGLDRHKVANYLFHMKVYFQCNDNPFFKKSFTPKFKAVQLACDMHIQHLRFKQMQETTKRADEAVNRLRVALQIQKSSAFNLN